MVKQITGPVWASDDGRVFQTLHEAQVADAEAEVKQAEKLLRSAVDGFKKRAAEECVGKLAGAYSLRSNVHSALRDKKCAIAAMNYHNAVENLDRLKNQEGY